MNRKLQTFRGSPCWISFLAALLPISATAEPETKQPGCVPKAASYFDPSAIRLGQHGTVLVEYSVNANGVTERVVVRESTASKSLERSAVRFVRGMQCRRGKDWQLNGGPQQRLKVNLLFQFRGREPATPIDPTAEVIVIAADPV